MVLLNLTGTIATSALRWALVFACVYMSSLNQEDHMFWIIWKTSIEYQWLEICERNNKKHLMNVVWCLLQERFGR